MTDEEQEEVRRLLAEAGGPLPMPSEVASRLEGVLAGLAEERAPSGGVVVPLARRRRRWARGLVAAATLMVAGYAVPTLLLDGPDAAEDASAGQSAGTPEGGADSGAAVTGAQAPLDLADSVRLAADTLDRDVQTLLDMGLARAGVLGHAEGEGERLQGRGAFRCTRPPLRPGDRWVLVRYDGRLVSLVLPAAVDGRVTARVHSCAGAELLDTASTTLR